MTRPNRYSTIQQEEQFFSCSNCQTVISNEAAGTHNRNHCPHCLWSLHVDIQTGDRRSGCRGRMEPISIWCREDEEWSLVLRCRKCGTIRPNRIAGDDDERQLLRIAVRPLTHLPFLES